MSLFKTVNERRILNSPTEPTSRSWLWLKTENGTSTLYDFINGAWTPVNGFSDKDTGHGSEYGGDIHNDADYVTWNGLNEILDKNLDTVSTWLSGYLKEADLSNFITQDDIDTAVAKSMNEALASYQKILTASFPLEIVNNKIRLRMGELAQGSEGPIRGGTAYAKFQDVFNRLNDKQDKLVSGADIKTINGVDILNTSNGSNLQLQTPISDLASIRSGAAAGATAVQINEFTGRLTNNLKQLKVGNATYSLVGNSSQTINIPTGSNTGGGIAADVLDQDDPIPEEPGVYFFAYSPLQVEGDYNNLLQNGIENGYSFSPGNLYSLGYSKHVVDGVEKGFLGFNMIGTHTDLDVRNNIVYINDQMTTMKYYGDVVVSNKVKYADTGTFSYISFTVACPFASPETLVTVSVDEEDKLTTSIKYLYDNGNWQDLPLNGFVFRNTGGSDSVTLKIERTDSRYNEERQITIHLYNGFSYEDINVIFNPATVFFKNGRCLNGFNINNINNYVDTIIANNAASTPNPNIDNIPTNQIVKINGIRDNKLIIKNNYGTNACLLMTDITIDESDFNVFYVVMERKGAYSWMEVGAYLKDWAGITASESRYRMYGLSVYAPSTQIIEEDVNATLLRKGEFIGECYCHKERTGGIKTVNMYFMYFNVEMVIQEFGVISYKNSTYPSRL